MSKRLGALGLILLATAFVILLPFYRANSAPQKHDRKRPLRCTAKALSALIALPKLEYECEGHYDKDLKSPARRDALKDYLQELESSFVGADWWATPVKDLNLCAITNEARALNKDERDELIYKTNLYGDDSTRLVVVVDPCIWYSFSTLNAYVLQRVGSRVYATQVLDAYYTRIDAAINMALAEHNGEKLVMVETHTSDGFMPPSLYTTYAFYTVNPRSHRAVPKKLFKEDGRLTHEFRCDDYLFSDEEDVKLAGRWRAPEIIRNGRLSPRFTVYTPIKHRLARSTYVWNGKFYMWQRPATHKGQRQPSG
jgi:hypothetical protein